MNIPKVEKNIPVPVVTKGRKPGALSLALEKLKKGESLFFEAQGEDRLKQYRNIYATAKRRGVSITSRIDEDGVRIWKT